MATTLPPPLIARPLRLSAACAHGISTSKRRDNTTRFPPLHSRRRHRYLLIILNPAWSSFWPTAKRISLNGRKLVSIILYYMRTAPPEKKKCHDIYIYAGNAIMFYSRVIGFFFKLYNYTIFNRIIQLTPCHRQCTVDLHP